ncbi:hypothetical protein ACQ4PT_021131 [Festuca glaucescens]
MADSGVPSPTPRCLSPSSRSRRRLRRAEVAAEGACRRLRGAEVAADGACRRVRPVEVGADGACRRVRPVEVHAPPLSGGGLTPQSPEEVGAEMGNDAVRAPRRSSAKRSANLERASQVRRMRDGGHTGRRFGDELSPGISKRVVSSDYDAEFGLSHVDSFGNSLSSSDKAVKSLKRDFAKFCNEAVIISKDFSKCDKDASTIYFEPASFSLAFKKNSHLRFGSTLEGKIIDGIIESVQYAITAKHRNVSKAELCVTNVLEFLKNLKSEPNLVTTEATIPNCERVIPNSVASPDGKMKISPKPNDVSGIQMSRGVTVEKKTSRSSTISGSKAAPILVAENSPKPILNSLKFNNGSKDFRLRQVELASKSDELYNKLNNNAVQKDIHPPAVKSQIDNNLDQYIDLSQHAAEEKFPKDDIIILQPKNSLELPLLQNRRFPVTNDDVKNFCSIVELAYTKGVQKSYSVKFSKENILDYNNEVQLGVISKAFLGAASASKGKRLELSDMLFFPICRSRHWFTFSVNFKFKLFIFLDSLYNKEDEFHSSIKNVLINNFVKLWQLIFQTEENIFRNFSVMYAKVPKQGNVDDCGVFTMKFMEIFKPEVDTCSLFSKEDIIHIRIQIANQLFFCKRNNVDKSVVLNYKIQA